MHDAQRIAAQIVRRVLAGSALPAVLAIAAEKTSRTDRALVQELAYGTLRFLGCVRMLVRRLAKRPLEDESVEALLFVALYQLIHTGAPAHAVVDQAVRATSQLRRTSAGGLVNAILRSFLRRRDILLAEVAREDEGRFSYPSWWIARVRAEYPENFAAILDAGNMRPPLTLRVNRRQLERGAYIDALAREGIAATAVGDTGVIVTEPRAVAGLPGYGEGWFSVQDLGAQCAAPLLAARDGMRVLDACAAPGGKTTHIAELADVELTAIDSDAQRIERVTENLNRLKLTARTIVADAAATSAWWDRKPFDRILLDVPCSASGIVRRHPDAKWLRREDDFANFESQQQGLLDSLWKCLAPDGLLLYATCSIFRAENQDQVSGFLAHHADATRVPIALRPDLEATGGQLLPAGGVAAHNHDGFFYALLAKN
jgi:16S rRNA (cytosine967-C5)-methyltransferase